MGEQAFEKMIAGLYLGEIFRLVLMEMIDAGDLFLGQNTYKLEKAYAFDTAFLSLMEADPTDELLMAIGIFNHFFGLETTLEERQFFRSLAKLIGTRSARLSACGIAAIVHKKGYLKEGCAVGADGSLYKKYPHFPERIQQALVDIFGEDGKKITTHNAEDGSGVGSAIIAGELLSPALELTTSHDHAAQEGGPVPRLLSAHWRCPCCPRCCSDYISYKIEGKAVGKRAQEYHRPPCTSSYASSKSKMISKRTQHKKQSGSADIHSRRVTDTLCL